MDRSLKMTWFLLLHPADVSLILVRRFAQKNRGSADPWLGCSYGKTGTGRPEPNRSQIYYKMRTDRPTPTGMKSLITDGRKFLPPSSRDRRSLLHHAFTPMSAIKGWRNRRLGTRRANPTQGGRLVYLSARVPSGASRAFRAAVGAAPARVATEGADGGRKMGFSS
jgi:hypothetical protein